MVAGIRLRFVGGAAVALLLAATLTAASASAVTLQAYTWGSNAAGQLGNGTMTNANVPGTITLPKAKSVAAGANFSLVLMSNGTVKAFGEGASGQLGDGSNLGSDVPVTVSGLTEVKAIAAEGSHDLALLKSGQVMAWGRNGNGEAGQGTTSPYVIAAPVAVPGVSAKAIAAGLYHSLAALKNGTVM